MKEYPSTRELLSEPEAAVLSAIHQVEDIRLAMFANNDGGGGSGGKTEATEGGGVDIGDNITVIDIGGGTTDVTNHIVGDNSTLIET